MTITAIEPESQARYDGSVSTFSTDSISNPGIFVREATSVLAEVAVAFNHLLAALGVRRPVELERLLKLDSKLSWQIHKVAGDGGNSSSGSFVPTRSGITRFLNGASEAGASAEQIARAALAYDRFEQLVQIHAGDRSSFNSLITSVAGPTSESSAADLQHRRNMFRGECHVMGMHAQTRLISIIVDKCEGGYTALFLTGYVGLRVLRPIDRVCVHGCRVEPSTSNRDLPKLRLRATGNGSDESFLLEDFCSRPLPAIRTERGSQAHNDRWIETSLVKPEVGNVGLTTLMFGEDYFVSGMPKQIQQHVRLPVETLIIDLLIAPNLLDRAPELSIFRGNDDPTTREPNHIFVPLMCDYKLQPLSGGMAGLPMADVPHYSEMIRSVTSDLSGSIDNFLGWRARLEYPPYHSTCRVRL